jgi:hypothetical protein
MNMQERDVGWTRNASLHAMLWYRLVLVDELAANAGQ